MKIQNHSGWDTAGLRRLISLALASWNSRDKKVPNKRLTVVVRTSQRGRHTGCAFYHSHWFTLRLPKPNGNEPMSEMTRMKAAYIIEHELAHCVGYHHRQMGNLTDWNYVNGPGGRERFGYALKVQVMPKAVTVAAKAAAKPKRDVQVERYLATVKVEAAWKSKLKRAQTAIKKYAARRKYYEGVLEKDGRLAALRSSS